MFSSASYSLSRFWPGNKADDSERDGPSTADSSTGMKAQPELSVTRLMVHPVKSCRGIPLLESRYTPRGLEHDRHWAVRSSTTFKLITARERSKLVLVVPEIDEERNVLRVDFPVESGLPGFEVRLRTGREDVVGWERLHSTKIFSETLSITLLCPATTTSSPSTPTPSEQFSTYLSEPCQFIQFLPLDYLLTDDGEDHDGTEEDVGVRPPRVTTPPVAPAEELDYGAHPHVASTGFADKYPVLLATEESLQDVQKSIELALSPDPPVHLGKIGPSFDRNLWLDRKIQMERFRPNVVISGAGKPWAEDGWKEVEFYPSAVEVERAEGGTAFEEGFEPSRGKMICTSRCGRCQLPNVDPVTGEADKAVPYKIIAKYRRVDPAIKYTPCFGVNAMPQKESGVIKVGDRVRVVKLNDWEVLPVEAKDA